MWVGRLDEHRGDPVGAGHALCVLDRDGDAGDERDLGQLVAVLEVGPQSPGADGEHDVVDGGAHLVLQALHVVEGDGARRRPCGER